MKKLTAFLLAVIMCFCTNIVANAEGETSGTCGDGVTWSYDASTNTLTIDGSGRMEDYPTGLSPWYQYKTEIKTIVVNSGVTYIGELAFLQIHSGGNDYTVSISLPEGLEEIGDQAFNNCGFETINLPASLKTMEGSVLANANQLKTITVSSGNTEFDIYEGALYTADFSKIVLYPAAATVKTHSIKSGCTTIGRSAFHESSITSVTIPSSVTEIEQSAFARAAFQSVEIPSSVKTIGASAFINSKLTDVTLNEGLESIGENAFRNANISSISPIPKTVKSIGKKAFTDTGSVEKIYLFSTDCSFPTGSGSSNDVFYNETELPDVCFIYSETTEEYLKRVDHTKYTILCKDGTENHSYEKTSTTATCTADGKATYTCSVCGHTKEEDEAALGHAYEKSEVAATCTEEGYTSYKCANCGDEYQTDFVDALGHTPKTTVVKEAEIGVEGLQRTVCTVCGALIDERAIPALVENDTTFNAKYKLFRVVAGVESAKVAVDFEKDIDGYEVYVASGDGDFKKRGTINDEDKNYLVLSNLTANKNYKFKLRAYKKIDGEKVYSKKFSEKISVRIKNF